METSPPTDRHRRHGDITSHGLAREAWRHNLTRPEREATTAGFLESRGHSSGSIASADFENSSAATNFCNRRLKLCCRWNNRTTHRNDRAQNVRSHRNDRALGNVRTHKNVRAVTGNEPSAETIHTKRNATRQAANATNPGHKALENNHERTFRRKQFTRAGVQRGRRRMPRSRPPGTGRRSRKPPICRRARA